MCQCNRLLIIYFFWHIFVLMDDNWWSISFSFIIQKKWHFVMHYCLTSKFWYQIQSYLIFLFIFKMFVNYSVKTHKKIKINIYHVLHIAFVFWRLNDTIFFYHKRTEIERIHIKYKKMDSTLSMVCIVKVGSRVRPLKPLL